MRRERLLEEQDPPAKIRNQSKYPLLSKAKKLEEKAAKYYRENNPRKADALLAEAIRLRGEEKARRRKNEKQESAKQ